MTKQQTEALKVDARCTCNAVGHTAGSAPIHRSSCDLRTTPSTAPSDTLETGAEPEEEAWTWLESKWLNIEAGHDPNDRDYSADEMVDAFIAGRDRRLAPAPMADTLERREAISTAREALCHFVTAANGNPEYHAEAVNALRAAVSNGLDLALSLPAREVSGERAREVLAEQYVIDGGSSEIAEAIRQDDQVLIRDDMAIRAMTRFATEALATTPAPRELEADLAEARLALLQTQMMLETIDRTNSTNMAEVRKFITTNRATLNRLSEEG